MTATRIVLITGAAQGLGKGIAEAFAALGDHVIVADRDGAGAQTTAQALGGESLELDITDPAAISAGVAAIAQQHGRIDVLVNNAGVVLGGGPMLDLDIGILDGVLAVNIRGTWLMTQAVGKLMAARKSGVIVNVSSVGARQPTPGLGHYEATKAAVDAITRTTAIELAPFGVRANAIAPGPIITPLTADMAANPAARAAWEARIPLGSIAEVERIAPAVVFLASPGAAHITGVSLPLDGGQLLV